MYQRNLADIIRKDLQTVPAVVLYGPRQVGKTTVVKQLAQSEEGKFLYLDLELPSDRVKLTDPELFLARFEDKTVILDEVQFVPDLFPVLRSLIDKRRIPGRFLLLGSVSPALLQHSAQSLAGRVRYRELFPFTLPELKPGRLNELWFLGGFPEAFLAQKDSDAIQWYAGFVRSYATRDLAMIGLPMAATQIERLLQMIAHQHGQLLNVSNLARSLGVSSPTVSNALYYLEEAMLIRTLKPRQNNLTKRLVKTPKIYIRDTGMLHYLLSVNSYEQLLGHPQAGNSWEGFVIQQILSVIAGSMQPYFYRTAAGAELDMLLVKGNRVEYAIEIKLSTAPQLSRGNTEAVSDTAGKHRVVIAPVAEQYPLKNKWEVFGIEAFLKELVININET
ncbi:MAG TPA: ATP-binding protein [Agriterribacter sp.]|nr:ATP-binding protein [Agriterribacter sp.]